MEARVAELIRALGLEPHPEGGFYRELWRSRDGVEPADGRGRRAALTTIYFLLAEGAVSRWHRVRSDEIWHHYEGAPLELLVLDSAHAVDTLRLGPLADGQAPVRVVPAGAWQAARSTGDYTLVGCSVGPGFDFADFALLADDRALADAVRRAHPEAALFL